MTTRAFWSMIAVCLFLPGESRAQQPNVGLGAVVYPFSPVLGPSYGYPAISGGPFYASPYAIGGLGYGGFGYGGFGAGFGYGGPGGFGYGGFGYPGFYGYSGRAGSFWSNGLSLYGPPVPVSGPVPGVFGNDDLVNQWRSTLSPGYGAVGVGIYATFPRPPLPFVPPRVEGVVVQTAPVSVAQVGGVVVLSVKVAQPAAEVLVNGRPTRQTGTDRRYESPPLEAGKSHTFTVTARWIESGQSYEMTKAVTGTPGEVVRVDLSAGR